MSIAWSSPKLYEGPKMVHLPPTMEPNLEGVELLTSTAELVFQDCKQNGFSKELAMGYNILVSAAHYLKTGEVMVGDRTGKFFTEEVCSK